MMSSYREALKDRKKIVIKIGSSSLMHPETGKLDLVKIEKLVRILCDVRNSGKDVVLVSSGAIAVGRMAIGLNERPDELPVKQACAAIGQARLMMIYQKIFAEYSQIAAQVLMTKYSIINEISRQNAENTFKELLRLGAIPVVNENDTVSTDEIQHVQTFGDNDRLSAIVSYLIGADLLILLSDIDGLYTDDPKLNKDARFIEEVREFDEELFRMGRTSSSSNVGTGGMSAKLVAAQIATYSGADMVITNADNLDNIAKIINGENVGTLFCSNRKDNFDLLKMIE
ncbi:MAG: glutamate 5-kinase [Clostridia bacterium]|nr:glutamate 5-kinase [Clostridia bacterium]